MFQPDKQGERCGLGLSLLWCVSAEAEEEGKWTLLVLYGWHRTISTGRSVFQSTTTWSGFFPGYSSMTLGLSVCMLYMACFFFLGSHLSLFFFFPFLLFPFFSWLCHRGRQPLESLKKQNKKKKRKGKKKREAALLCSPSIHPVPLTHCNT